VPEADGEIPLTGDPKVDEALVRIRGKFRDLEDAMLVQAHLELRASERIKEHAEFLARHQAFLDRHATVIGEIEDKLNALIDREIRREGGPEAR